MPEVALIRIRKIEQTALHITSKLAISEEAKTAGTT
jgi:hypothetical protein